MSSDAQSAFGVQSEPKRASKAGYWLAGLVGFVAVAGAIAWFVVGITGVGDAVDDLQRLPIPGAQIVQLEEGKNAVYYEGRRRPGLELTLEGVDGGPQIVVGPHSGDTTYDVGGRHGRSIAGFTLQEGGSYRMTVQGEAPSGAMVAVGKGVGGQIVKAVAGGLGIFFGGLLLCGALIALTAARRKSP